MPNSVSAPPPRGAATARAAKAGAAPAGAAAAGQASRPRVFAFAAGDSYTSCFNAALRALGIEVMDADWSGRWLMGRVRRGDVLHLHWPSFMYAHPGSSLGTWWGLLRFASLLTLLRVRGARIVWTAHNLYPHDGGRAVVHRLGRRIVVALAARVCVHGRAAAQCVQREFGVPERVLVVLEHGNWVGFYPNGVTREAARQRLGCGPEEFLYLFVGLCKPYKNLELLVRSHAALADDSLLWIVGRFQSTAYHEQVRQAAAAADSSRTTLIDRFVPPEELQLYLNACDAVVLPYREILTSGAAMLALSFGRPIVAPRLGALPEVATNECGVLYDSRVDTGLRDAMRAVRERRFTPERILRHAQQFSWVRSAETFARAILPLQG